MLIVDDDVDAADTTSDILEIHEIQVAGKAQNGKIALAEYAALNPDIVLLDLSMPDYDGFYFLEHLKKDDVSKVIIITGAIDESTHNKLKGMNVKTTLFKPVDVEELIESIKQ